LYQIELLLKQQLKGYAWLTTKGGTAGSILHQALVLSAFHFIM
jgi:hypothetical protein